MAVARQQQSDAGKISPVQVLRAVAASMVVFYHSVELITRTVAPSQSALVSAFDYVILGNGGVDLFFCLSGFVMVYIHGDDFGSEGASSRFLRKRLLRIAPIYWLLTTMAVALMLLAPHLFRSRGLDWTWIAMSYLFVPWMSNSGVDAPVLGLGWTLNFEMYFYACFALLLLMPRRVFLPVLTCFFAASAAIGLLVPAQHPLTQMLTSPMLLEFLLGCYIGAARRNGILLSTGSGISMTAVAVIIFAVSARFVDGPIYPPPLRPFFWGMPAALVLAAVTLTQWHIPCPKSLVFVGDASYSIYLTHGFTVPAVAKVASAVYLAPYAVVALLFVSSIVVGCGFYLVVEKRILKFQRLGQTSTHAYSAASPG